MIAIARMSTSMDHPFSRTINTASAPLPLIPRRTSHSMRSPEIVLSSSVQVTIQPSSPPLKAGVQQSSSTDSDSSSSSGPSDSSLLTMRPKRIRGVRTPALCPPELSTPTPSVHHARITQGQNQAQASSSARNDDDDTPRPARPLVYCPGVPLRLQAEGYKSRARASSESPAGSNLGDNSQPRLIRKKSGQLVKPSLKTSKSRDSLTVVTRGTASKSEPSTPTHAKNVHFDSKLEHVKLFLAEQKPLAVSRDGSPTEDTSGTDNDFPSFIFGESDARSGKKLVMQLPNMPPNVDLNANIALEELVLSPDSTCILGKVRLRNIAYAKWLAIRFTFDSWQTTSEVTGKYVEAIDRDFDRFSFSIRLNDLLARIEGKTLYMALRYTVAGKEFWDNNRGANYLAEFTKVAPKLKASDDEKSAGSAIADLRSKLERVALGEGNASLPQLSSDSGLKGTSSLSARYDFGTSLKESWQPTDFVTPSPRHIRTQSYPTTGTIATPNSVPWPEKARAREVRMITPTPMLGSPRDLDDEAIFSGPRVATDFGGSSFTAFPTRHHRRGYFDDCSIAAGSQINRTSPGTPRSSPFDEKTPMSRFHSFPPVQGPRSPIPFGLGLTPASADSDSNNSTDDQSTPSLASPSSSSSRSSTPSPSETFLMQSLMGTFGNSEQPASPNTNYRQFLTK